MTVFHLSPAAGETRTPATHPLRVCITPTVQRDYIRRGLFTYFRAGNAAECMSSGVAVFWTTMEEARDMLVDAGEAPARARAGEALRGTLTAFTALKASLTRALDAEARRGLWPDPGIEAVAARREESYARFEVGDRARYSAKYEDDPDDEALLEVVETLKLRSTLSENGPYVASNGTRLEYIECYVVKFLEGSRAGERGATAAHTLRDLDFKIAHLRMVR